MIKKIIGGVAGGMAIAVGTMAGSDLYCALRNPVTRKQIKKKITSVFKKEKD